MYFTPWWASKRDFSPFRIAMVSATEGSTTSIFWKRRGGGAARLDHSASRPWRCARRHHRAPPLASLRAARDAGLSLPDPAPPRRFQKIDVRALGGGDHR